MTSAHIGKSFFVATALPATNNASGFEALTWVEVAGWQTLPQLGVSHSNIDVPDGKSGFTAGLKGAGAGNDSTATFRLVASDAGQVALRAAADENAASGGGAISVKIATGTGTNNAVETGDKVQYAQGYGHSYVEVQGDNSTHEGFSVNFKQNAVTIDATEPA